MALNYVANNNIFSQCIVHFNVWTLAAIILIDNNASEPNWAWPGNNNLNRDTRNAEKI